MRTVTRNALLAIGALIVLLLALGAVPSLLKSGDPYYLTATPAEGDHEAVNGSELPSHRYPFTAAALADGQSEPYWDGPVGFKEAFTHSPFDERSALGNRNPAAVEGDTVYVTQNGTLYRVAITQDV
ncbi:hypothetical protein [Haladaptatus sp. DYSN1]|uniref:hypothetical protein n=1 Tax=unclassified Haladaptatus TaxID=2622732 RepID=UPI0024073265|nr:hypothetical protein [Haladaptatus sp. DYSN1]